MDVTVLRGDFDKASGLGQGWQARGAPALDPHYVVKPDPHHSLRVTGVPDADDLWPRQPHPALLALPVVLQPTPLLFSPCPVDDLLSSSGRDPRCLVFMFIFGFNAAMSMCNAPKLPSPSLAWVPIKISIIYEMCFSIMMQKQCIQAHNNKLVSIVVL